MTSSFHPEENEIKIVKFGSGIFNLRFLMVPYGVHLQKFIKMYANISTAFEPGRSLMAYIYLTIPFHVRLVSDFWNRASPFQTSHICGLGSMGNVC